MCLSTQAKARIYLDHLLQDCGEERLHAGPNITEGQNVFGERGVGADNQLDPPEEASLILYM